MAGKKLTPLLVLENGTLLSMALNRAILDAFPFLGLIVSQAGVSSCGSCSAAAKETKLAAYDTVKQRIATMSSEMQRKLAGMLGAEQFRVYYKSTGGRAMSATLPA